MKERAPTHEHPLDPGGRRPREAAPEGVSARALELQRSVGNRATGQLIGRLQPVPAGTVQRVVEKIGEEEVDVSRLNRKKERAEAEAIIKEIKDKYGVDLSSKTTIEGIKEHYTAVSDKVKKSLETRRWRMIDLRSLKRALAFYAPILGAERGKSTRKDAEQEVTSVGKVKQSIEANKPTGDLDTTTLGEFFKAKKNMGLFKASEGYKSDFKKEEDQLTGTFIHEIAHGLLEYALPDYIKETGGYWKDRNTKSKKAGAEAPITDYGTTNAAEDLCESAMMFFLAPTRLKNGDGGKAGEFGNPAPLRYAFMEKIGKAWIPPPEKTPLVAPAPAKPTGTPVIGGHRASPPVPASTP